MINWEKSAELNDCTVEWLKVEFEKYPNSNKRIIRICNSCDEERSVVFCNHSDLCGKCSRQLPKIQKLKSKSMIKFRAKEMDPLPIGQEIQIPNNKNCGNYLGCIAEELLAKTFKDVRRMPPNNKGYDIICNQDKKIEVKSSATGHKGFWSFGIGKNKIADYFLCVAFESRENLIPIHLWLITGKDINHLTSAVIHKSTLDKWSQYKQSLNRILTCCNVMRKKNE